MVVRVFVSYSHKDQPFRDALDEHLAPLMREHIIQTWHDRKITPGEEWKGKIDKELTSADIVLLLVSPSFIASDYCFDVELAQAIERHEAGQTIVIPIVIRPCDWHKAPFAKLQALPEDGRPISLWPSQDEAFVQIAKALRKAAEAIPKRARRTEVSGSRRLLSMPQLLAEEMTRLDEAHVKAALITGISTGLIDVDELCDGLQRGSLYVIASRPLMGKSTLLLNIVGHVAANQRVPTALFSLRMSAGEAARQITADLSNVRRDSFQRGRLASDDWNRLGSAIATLNEAPLHIDDSGSTSMNDIKNGLRQVEEIHGKIGMAAIDNLHLVRGASTKSSASLAVRDLRNLAREHDCAVIVTLPVSQAVEARPNKRPVFRDLDEWAVMEEEANVVMFLYRDEVYWDDSLDVGTAELLISKNDFGQSGTVRLRYKEQRGFSDFGVGEDLKK